ncbi:MAG: PAS domain-containing protein [Dissulfurispiraceae bacterium]
MGDAEKTTDEISYEIAYLRVVVADLEQKNRQAEDLLHVVTEQYHRITEVVSDYIFSVHIVDGNPVETVHGRGCLPITGYSPDEFASNNFLWINMAFEEDRPLVLRHVAGILSGKDTAPFEHRIVRKDGALRWVRNTPVCQYDAEGKLLAYDGLIQDITEKRQAQAALQNSEEKYRIVADFTYDWEEWLGPDGQYLYVSPSCERITGYRPEEFLANPDLVTMITHSSDQAMVATHYNDAQEDSRETHNFDFRIITKGGQQRWISHSCQPVFSENGKWLGRRASNHDISERRQLMEELMKVRELEAVGILARGIAHDFNNLITAILGNVSVARKIATQDDRLNDLLANAEEASLRSAELTQQLISFAKRGKPSKKRLQIGELIRKKAAPAVDGNGLKLNIVIPDDLWIEGDEYQLSEAIRNIMLNSKESTGGNGVLTVSAANTLVRDRDNLMVTAGDYIKISVIDAGGGMLIGDTPRILDPFFAMRDMSAPLKTGLGLAIAYSTVANHDGVITIASEVGKGTTFNIYLPAAK